MVTKKRSLRILITPNVPNSYDQRMVKELAGGFNALGHYAGAMSTPLTPSEIAKMCESLKIDVVLQINRTRDPNTPLPPNVRHISWYQDVFPETIDGFAETFHDSDILYALGDPSVLGLNVQMPCLVGSLFTGVDQTTLDFKYPGETNDIDFSLCGGLPPSVELTPSVFTDLLWYFDSLVGHVPIIGRTRLLWIVRKILFSRHLPIDYVPYSTLLSIKQIVEGFYRPLRGELDIHMLTEAMLNQSALLDDVFSSIPKKVRNHKKNKLSRVLKPHTFKFSGRTDFKARLIRYLAGESSFDHNNNLSPVQKAISYFSQSYPRIMDRKVLVEAASKVSKSLELYGPGLSAHDFTQPYYKGVIDTQEKLLEIYCRSKINLSNNTHGLGIHSRTLECMAVGGFLLMHESPHDNKAGGMLTSFEPGVHYGSYTPENLIEEATRWLKDASSRIRAGKKAQSVIHERHMWHHRAQQIVEDLHR